MSPATKSSFFGCSLWRGCLSRVPLYSFVLALLASAPEGSSHLRHDEAARREQSKFLCEDGDGSLKGVPSPHCTKEGETTSYLNSRLLPGGGGLLVRVADEFYFTHDNGGIDCTPVSYLSADTEVPYAVWHAPWYFKEAMRNETRELVYSDPHCPSAASTWAACPPDESVGLDPPKRSAAVGWDFPVVTSVIGKRFEEGDSRVRPSALYSHDSNSCNDAYADREGREVDSFWGRHPKTGQGCRMGISSDGGFEWAGDLCCAPGGKGKGKGGGERVLEGHRCLTRLERQCECEWEFGGPEGDWKLWVEHYIRFRGSNEGKFWKKEWQKYLNLAICWFPPTAAGFEALTSLQNELYRQRDRLDDHTIAGGYNHWGVRRWWGWNEVAAPRDVADPSLWDALAIKLPPGADNLHSLSKNAQRKLPLLLRSVFLTVRQGMQWKEKAEDLETFSGGLLGSMDWHLPVLVMREVQREGEKEGVFRREFFCQTFDLDWAVLRFHEQTQKCVLCEKGARGFSSCMEMELERQNISYS
uniref:Uncharacterized protein n=1 Tax=Chromera velia CCMP2878 TaxID=1169474 RepID=A0A0G4F8J1_9ALVE|eukprot:Cvel_15783.t1-p1 / transcript=Cvel_15783.t1 / gene=Cvel_15783 / organism=Chromera_velia_CCMP2878 / gene_product=hypothetical protein / transcript_product=hypothetical protein / location=Cvel_scaffold1184:20918-23884(+) / protein_length=527 / sequence_SO=supercontig / SO=protein_coding / is_pseudo=false